MNRRGICTGVRALVVGTLLALGAACGGSSTTTPTTPSTPAVANPLVSMWVEDVLGQAAGSYGGTITMSVDGVPTGTQTTDQVAVQQRLTPGPHEIVVTSWTNVLSLNVYLSGGAAGNTGGVQPNSVSINYSAGHVPPSLQGLAVIQPCYVALNGSVLATTWNASPLAQWDAAGAFLVVDFTVVLADAPSVCGG
jgi:hypothetical protein